MLRRAGIKVTVCSLENELVTCAKHVVIKSDIILPKLDNPKQFDALILPGGIKGATFMKESPAAKTLCDNTIMPTNGLALYALLL